MFTREPQRYGATPEPVTPYQKAGQVWDERLGSAHAQAKNWRLAAFGALTIATLLAGGMIWLGSQSRITPYVVEVDKLGEPRVIAAASESFQPSDPQIAWYLGRFITNVRSLSIDPVVVRQNWLEAYDFATDRGATFLNEYARANDPFTDVGNRTVSIQITSVVRASDNTYQIKWREQSYKQGSLTGTEHWTAMLTMVTQTPRKIDALRKNPLGIYVNGVSWTQELGALGTNGGG
ncbi:MAG: conjugal transfer protein TrbF [Rhodospirillaceae bacterium]|nr:conjugal transfer protein TrbF [Rhodospirillaceae bacterium]